MPPKALAQPTGTHAAKTVTVVMHDPGCHWFAVGKAFKTSLSVKGPVSLRNVDEATLKVVGPHGTKLDRVGGSSSTSDAASTTSRWSGRRPTTTT